MYFYFDSTIIYLLSSGNSYAKVFGVEMILILGYSGRYLSMVGVSNAFTAQSKFRHCTIASSDIIILKQHW